MNTQRTLMKLIRRVALILAVCLVSVQTAFAAEEPMAVRADGVAFPLSLLQRDYDAMLESYRLLGGALTPEVREQARQEITDQYVIRALTEAWLIDQGLHDLAPDTVYALRDAAQQQFDAYWQAFRDMEQTVRLSDAEVSQYLDERGVTVDHFYDSVLAGYYTQLLLERMGVLNEVSEEEVEQFFRENFLEPDRARYEKDIPLFEEEVLYGERTSTFVPEGFRAVTQIVLPVPEEIRAELDAIEQQAVDAAARAEAAYDRVAALALEGKDVTEAGDEYRAAHAEIEELNIRYGQTWQSVLEATRAQCDELYARMAQGERFADLARLFAPAETLIYHRDSAVWPDDLKAAADTLTAIGDVSEPVLCSDGVHILCYHDDIDGGEMVPGEEERRQIRTALEEDRLMSLLRDLTAPWHDKYHLTVDLSALKE